MTCEKKDEGIINPDIVIAANKLNEIKETGRMGSPDHETAMVDLLNGLHQPGALEAYEKLSQMQEGVSETKSAAPPTFVKNIRRYLSSRPIS